MCIIWKSFMNLRLCLVWWEWLKRAVGFCVICCLLLFFLIIIIIVCLLLNEFPLPLFTYLPPHGYQWISKPHGSFNNGSAVLLYIRQIRGFARNAYFLTSLLWICYHTNATKCPQRYLQNTFHNSGAKIQLFFIVLKHHPRHSKAILKCIILSMIRGASACKFQQYSAPLVKHLHHCLYIIPIHYIFVFKKVAQFTCDRI